MVCEIPTAHATLPDMRRMTGRLPLRAQLLVSRIRREATRRHSPYRLGSAKLNDLDWHAWFADVIDRVA
jgi:hypothetical protein